MNIFDGLAKYAAKFQVKSSRPFSEEELASVVSAKVVLSQYGKSVCFFMKSGCQQYIPLSNESVAEVGAIIDASKVTLLFLNKDDGGKDIIRIKL